MSQVRCNICPHYCYLSPGQTGICRAIGNVDGLIRYTIGCIPSAIDLSPIEKRPLFHFTPGENYLSVGFFGCSFSCNFCLPGDTLIRTPTGLKRIDQMRDGDEIIAFDDLSSCPRPVLAHVGHVFDRVVEEVIELQVDGQTIQLTPEHPVYTRRGWVEAKDLTDDDEVLCDRTYLESSHSQTRNEQQDMPKME